MNREQFKEDLRFIINKNGMDSEANTPDFVLADYLMDCFSAFRVAAERRDIWRLPETTANPELSKLPDLTPVTAKCVYPKAGE